jgi:catechol 2,3-dioxygenase-like lactoylglutathione lyase family enzyme
MRELIAFVAATDLSRARAFYEGTLWLRVISEEPSALVLDVHGTMLRVSKVDNIVLASYTVLGWMVDDIVATTDRLTHQGVTFERFKGFPQDERGIWTAGDGTRVAWFRDPDGNLLSVTQFR